MVPKFNFYSAGIIALQAASDNCHRLTLATELVCGVRNFAIIERKFLQALKLRFASS